MSLLVLSKAISCLRLALDLAIALWLQKIILFEKGEKGITSTMVNEVLYNISYVPLTGSYGTSDKMIESGQE